MPRRGTRQSAVRTPDRVLLGHHIAYHRRLRRVSQAALGRAAGLNQSRITLLENGETTISVEQLAALLDQLEVHDAEIRTELERLHANTDTAAATRESTSGIKSAVPERLRLLVGLEERARTLLVTGSELLPGLLQTEDYARSLLARKPLLTRVTVDDAVRARMNRKQALTRPEGAADAHFILAESCLRRRWAPPAVMHEQMLHLAELSHLPNVILQILDDARTETDVPWMPMGWALLEVPTHGTATDLRMLYTEGIGELYYRNDPETLEDHQRAGAALAAEALDQEATREMIRYYADDYDGMPRRRTLT